LVSSGSISTASVAEALEKIEQAGVAKPSAGSPSVAALVIAIQSSDAAEIRTDTPRILEILSAAVHPRSVQIGLSSALIRASNQRTATEILDCLNEHQAEIADRSGLSHLRLYALVRLARPKWQSWVGSDERAASLIDSAINDPDASYMTVLAAQYALRESTFSESRRGQILISLITRSRTSEIFQEPGLVLLRPQDFPPLRALVRQSGHDVPNFHFGAASVLVHLGDEAIIPDLAERRVSFTAFDKKFGVWIDDQIKMIRSQHPPEQLLDLIRNLDDDRPDFGRDLATRTVERASQVLAIADVRQAALQRAESVQARLDQTTDKTIRRILESGMRRLREVSLRVQVLTEEDLPEFKPDPRFHSIGHSDWPDFE
jgi:hypothetical protein